MRERGCVAILSERGDDRRGQVHVALFLQELEEDGEALGTPKVADEIDEREADVDIADVVSPQPLDDGLNGRFADPHQGLGGGVPLPGVLGIGQRSQEPLDDLRAGVAHQAVDDGLAHAPVLVAEELEHQRQVPLDRRVGNQKRRLLPGIRVGGAGLFDDLRVCAHSRSARRWTSAGSANRAATAPAGRIDPAVQRRSSRANRLIPSPSPISPGRRVSSARIAAGSR